MEFTPRRPAEIWHLLLVCAVPLLVLGAVSYIDRLEKSAGTFDVPRLEEVKKSRADVALIGNSMLGTRVGRKDVRELASPNRITYLDVHGSRSLAWYLLLKNFVTQADPAPKLAVIFYRDYDFNAIDQHLDGIHLERLRQVMRPEDEPLLRMARGGGVGGGGWSNWLTEDFLPDRSFIRVRRQVAKLPFSVAGLGGQEKDLEVAVNEAFDYKFLRADTFDAGALDAESDEGIASGFDAGAQKTFLPNFIELAKKYDIKLCFYRIKRRPNENNIREQTDELRAYTSQFKSWAEANGHHLIDETDDPTLTLAMYNDGDHFAAAAKRGYTETFLKRIRHLLPKPLEAPAQP